ncbi:MAG: hypothetical protein ACO1PB_07155 [Ramlibacter sp.]
MRAALARHLAAGMAAGLVLAGSLAALDRLGRASTLAGVAWLVGADSVLGALPASADARVLGAWFGGRLVQVHAESLRETAHWQVRRALVLRLPRGATGWATCG